MTTRRKRGTRSRARKSETKPFVFAIPPGWSVERSVLPSGSIRFDFHTSDACPGHELEILPFRLVPSRSTGERHNEDALILRGVREIERVLGASAFPNHHKAIAKAKENAFGITGLLRLAPASVQTARISKAKEEIAEAWIQDLCSPNVARLVFPLAAMIKRCRCAVTLAKMAWPYAQPPTRLEDLLQNGFESPLPYGIVAYARNGKGAWAVSRFMLCEKQLNIARVIRTFLPDLKRLLVTDDSLSKAVEKNSRRAGKKADFGACGGLKVLGDFESVLFGKEMYDLTEARQVQEMLRYMASCKQIGPRAEGVTKQQIMEHLIVKGVVTKGIDWRPSFAFRGRLASLYDAIGCQKRRGRYWIK